MKVTFFDFLRTQFTTLPEVDVPNLAGRTVIVTGSNIGLGFETAKSLATQNPAKLILAVRNQKAGEEAAREIVDFTHGKCVPEVWRLDLGDLSTVKAFGERAKKELDRVDIFISNAGVAQGQYQVTVDGMESTSQINNVANSLLCLYMIPLLHKASRDSSKFAGPAFKPHMTIVSSEVHHWIGERLRSMAKGREDHVQFLQEKENFDSNAHYQESKAINILNADRLSELAGKDIIVNTVNPGLCHSSLSRSSVGLDGWILWLLKAAVARTTEVGARTIVWAAVHDVPSNIYSADCRVTEPSDFVQSPEAKEVGIKIWEEMREIWRSKLGVEVEQIVKE